jgi:hypothetical protein
MRNSQRVNVANSWGEAVFVGLAAAALVIVVIKLVTGIAFGPLAVVAFLVFAIVTALRLRMIRTG